MDNEIIVCIPGTWENRTKFIESVAVSTSGDFVFAGMILAHPKGNDHVELEFYDAHEQMAEAFEFGGQGKLSDTILDKLPNIEASFICTFLSISFRKKSE